MWFLCKSDLRISCFTETKERYLELNIFRVRKTSISCFIRLRFQGYRCKFKITLTFPLKGWTLWIRHAPLNYAEIPFNTNLYSRRHSSSLYTSLSVMNSTSLSIITHGASCPPSTQSSTQHSISNSTLKLKQKSLSSER